MEITAAKGKFYLLPSPLSESPAEKVLPAYIPEVIRDLRYFIVEEIRTARRFLKKVNPEIKLNETQFLVYNEHSGTSDLSQYMEPLAAGNDVGLLSEAGLPCIADPGSAIVNLAHSSGYTVIPLTGPSSIFLALMASGFPGQNFAFHGYLPVNRNERSKKIREMERAASALDQVQIFIETPYRNMQVFEALLATCRAETRICIAAGLTGASEKIMQKSVREWKEMLPDIHRKPVVFLLFH